MLFVLTVALIGVLHTLVPDHWAPIAVFARQRGWTRWQTAEAAALAGAGHVVSTLLIGLVAWFVGTIAAQRLGHVADKLSGGALVLFGLWVAIGAWREKQAECRDPRAHRRGLPHQHHTHHRLEGSKRMALLFILGSSPSVEALPVFFAAAHQPWQLLVVMAVALAVTTIGTYIATCVASHVGLERASFPMLEEYGEVFSGAIVALIGLYFLFF